jgi:hypothetical protein
VLAPATYSSSRRITEAAGRSTSPSTATISPG